MASQFGKSCERTLDYRFLLGFLGASLLLGGTLGECATCNVPSATYPSIQHAVNVVTCTEIILASGSFFGHVTIGRTLELQGVSSNSTTVIGKVTVQGSGTIATLKGLKIAVGPQSLPYGGLVVVGNAEVISDDLLIGTTDQIFADGFESGDASVWSFALSTACIHDLCETGLALDPNCDSCVNQICAADDYCCTVMWDRTCVDQVASVCGKICHSCVHDFCETGLALDPLCHSCVGQICTVDDFCCTDLWDRDCVDQVTSVCGLTCN